MRMVFAWGIAALACAGCSGDNSVPPDGGGDATTSSDAGDASSDAPSDASSNAGDASSDASNDAGQKACPSFDGGVSGTLDKGYFAGVLQEFANPQAAAVDSSGNLYIAGWENANAPAGYCWAHQTASAGVVADLIKLTATGSVDTSFGTSGHYCLSNQVWNSFNAVAVDPTDGSVVVAGAQELTEPDGGASQGALLLRLTSKGQPVSSFGTAGVVRLAPFGAGMASVALALALDSSSPPKILVAGSNGTLFGPPMTAAFVQRLDSNGLPDLGFDSGAALVDTSTNGFLDISASGGGAYVSGFTGAAPFSPVLRKVDASGAWDSSFNGGNPLAPPLTANSHGAALGLVGFGGGVAVATVGLSTSFATAVTAYSSTASSSGTVAPMSSGQPVLGQYQYGYHLLSTDCQERLLYGGYVTADGGALNAAIPRIVMDGGSLAMDTQFGSQGVASVVGLNAAPGLAPIQDPVTGRLIIVMRARGANVPPYLAVAGLVP